MVEFVAFGTLIVLFGAVIYNLFKSHRHRQESIEEWKEILERHKNNKKEIKRIELEIEKENAYMQGYSDAIKDTLNGSNY